MAKASLEIRVIDSGGDVPAAATGPGGGAGGGPAVGGGPLRPGRSRSSRPPTGRFADGPGGGGPSSLRGVARELSAVPGLGRISGIAGRAEQLSNLVTRFAGATGPAEAAGTAAGAGAAGAKASAVAGKAGAAGAAGATGVASLAGPIGLAAAAFVAGTALATVAVKKFADNAEAEARRLSPFSGELALATAQTDIRREIADLRRARRIGPAAARFETRRSQLETEVFDLITEIKVVIFQLFELARPLIDFASKQVTDITKILAFLNKFEAITNLIGDFIKNTNPVIRVITDISGWVQFIAELFGFEGQKEEDLQDPFFEQFVAMVQQGAAAGPDDAQVATIKVAPEFPAAAPQAAGNELTFSQKLELAMKGKLPRGLGG